MSGSGGSTPRLHKEECTKALHMLYHSMFPMNSQLISFRTFTTVICTTDRVLLPISHDGMSIKSEGHCCIQLMDPPSGMFA